MGARTDGATVKAVRNVYDDCFHVGTVETTSAGFRAYTARGLGLGTFDTESAAESAVYAAVQARRSAH